MVVLNNNIRKYLLIPVLQMFLIDFMIIFLFAYIKGIESITKILIISVGVVFFHFIFFILPLIILFINHYADSKKKEVHILYNDVNIVIKSHGIVIRKSDVQHIEVFLTYPLYGNNGKGGGLFLLVWDEFYYYRIVTKDGMELYISCLLLDGELYLKDIPVQRIKKYFPLIPSSPKCARSKQ